MIDEFDQLNKRIIEFLGETRMMFLMKSYDLQLSPHTILITMKLKITKTELIKRLNLLTEKRFITKHKEYPLYKVTSSNISKYSSNFK